MTPTRRLPETINLKTQQIMKNILLHSSFVLTIFGFTSCTQKNPQTTVQLQGKVKLESIALVPKIAGRIEKINVEEGQRVHKGDTIVVLSVPELTAKLEQANGAIEAAAGQLELASNGATEDQMQQIQSQVEAAEAQREFAAQSFRRVENMYRDSLIPAQQYDDARSKFNMAVAQVKALKAKQQEIHAGARPEVLQSARGQLQRAKGAKDEVLQAGSERYILAPADMTIENIALKEGELATPGYTIVNGYAAGGVYFRFTVGEKSVNAYPVGKAVQVEVPHTEKAIAAKVVAVKQLPRYADNTSTAPNRQVAEGFYELKVVPENVAEAANLFNNSTVILQ